MPQADELVDVSIRGRIAAGGPIKTQEIDLGQIPVAKGLLRGRGGYALEVDGRSMIEAGIEDGDYVIIRQQAWADEGDIVVARMGGECTLKRFFYEDNHFRLEPENEDMEPIHVTVGEFRIQGKVIGVLKEL